VTLLGRRVPLFAEGMGVRCVWLHLCVLFALRLTAAVLKIDHEVRPRSQLLSAALSSNN